MKKIKTTEAVGHVLCHDITRIIKDVTKDVAFSKGHVVRVEDIPVLLSLGKDNLYIWEKTPGMLHENEAVELLRDLCAGQNIATNQPKEGKIELRSTIDGLLQVDVDRLDAVNSLDDIIISTRHTHLPVKRGDKLAGTRVIPLVIHVDKLKEAQRLAGDNPIMQVLPYRAMKVGVVTTGNEVYHGRIKDAFTPVIREKLAAYNLTVCGHHTVPDDLEMITNAVRQLLDYGADMILCTGGMSVDPDDLTPTAIRTCGAVIVSYGAPVLPGAMFLMAYMPDGTPVMGLPGCVMYENITIFDLILPRVVAGVTITKQTLAKMGHGGLCMECDACTYPYCQFGKGE